MQFPERAEANGRPALPLPRVGAGSELDQLRASCRSQALTIDALGGAVSALRRGTAARKAENAELRAERNGGRARARGRGPVRSSVCGPE